MSVDNPVDEIETEASSESAPVGSDFQTDLVHVGRTVSTALSNLEDGQDPRPALQDLAAHFEDEGIPPEEAIAAAWFFILGFAE